MAFQNSPRAILGRKREGNSRASFVRSGNILEVESFGANAAKVAFKNCFVFDQADARRIGAIEARRPR